MTDQPESKIPDGQWGPTQDMPKRRLVSAAEVQKLPLRLGRYTLIERLGAGGMAEVFLATQDGPSGFTKKVVVKRIHTHLAQDKRFVDMFKREALLVARLNHQNVVQVYELGEEEGIYFIAMEHIDGLSLNRLARRAWRNGRSMPMEVILGAIADAALGLHHAHELRGDDGRPVGVIHRDISPENLMINKDGTTKVLDFGIARGADTTGVTKTGEIKGKLPFMSPEQIRGDDLDARSDLYSLGVTLYWLLTGRLPLSAKSELMLLNVVLTEKPAPPSAHNAHVPQFLDDLCLALLEKEPEDRPATGLAVYELLAPLAPVRTQLAAPYVADVLALPELSEEAEIVTDGFVPSMPQTDSFALGWLHPTPRTSSQPPEVALEERPRKAGLIGAVAGLAVFVSLVAVGGWVMAGAAEDPLPEPATIEALAPKEGALPGEAPTDASGGPEEGAARDAGPGVDEDVGEDGAPAGTTGGRGAEAEDEAEEKDQRPQQRVRRVEGKAPGHVRWLSSKGALLGKGDGSFSVPVKASYVIAYDPARAARITVPIENGVANFDRVPTGELDVRAFPWADVFLGSEKLGTTPFQPKKVLAGRYKVRLVLDDKEEVRTVTVKKGSVARIKVDFRDK